MHWGGIHDHLNGLKLTADAVAGLVALGAISKILPSLAALFTVLWLGIRIWESDTVRSLTGRLPTGKRADD